MKLFFVSVVGAPSRRRNPCGIFRNKKMDLESKGEVSVAECIVLVVGEMCT